MNGHMHPLKRLHPELARWFLLCFWVQFTLVTTTQAQSMRVGGNLDLDESGRYRVFVDLFRQSRGWMTRRVNAEAEFNSEKADMIPADRNGWPLQVPFDPKDGSGQHFVHTVVGARGKGSYWLELKGHGRLRFTAADGLLDATTTFLRSIEFRPSGGAFEAQLNVLNDLEELIFVDLLESDPADPIRDIHLYQPGVTGESTGAFDPLFIASVSNFEVLRFLNPGRANNSPLSAWEQRPMTTTHTQLTAGGMAFEWMFELGNLVRRPVWICVPHRADDDFVRQLARLAKERLSPGLKLFVEYSNETWNHVFEQADYVEDQGVAVGLGPQRYEAGQRFVARRSAQIWAIFEQEFGEAAADRLVKVMATQAGNLGLSRLRLESLSDTKINTIGTRADVLAIAPYFGISVADRLAAPGSASTVGVEQILQAAALDIEGEAAAWTRAHRDLAAEFGLWLVDYEAGQHLVATTEEARKLESILIAANRSPVMAGLYESYLESQQRNGVVLCNLFSHLYEPGPYGSWGLLETLNGTSAPKWAGFTKWQLAHPSLNLLPRAAVGADETRVITTGLARVDLDGSGSRDLDGRVTSFRWSVDGIPGPSGAKSSVDLALGRHTIRLRVEDERGGVASAERVITLSPASAASIALDVDFSSVKGVPTLPWGRVHHLDSGVVYSGLGAGTGAHLDSASGRLEFWVAGSGSGEVQTMKEALAAGDYLTFRLQPVRPLDLRGALLNLRWRRLTFHAARQWGVVVTVGGVPLSLETSDRQDSVDEPISTSWTLPFEGFGSVVEPVEFRLYAFGEQFHGHPVAIEALSLGGSTISVSPRLEVRRVGTSQIELSWSDNGFVLESATDLAAPRWEVVSGAKSGLVLEARNGPRFFRLRSLSP